MEIEQNNLDHFLKNQKLPFEQKGKIMLQLSQSIQFFQKELKSIHRDIKPENFIQVGDQFKLIDFGAVRYNDNCIKTAQIGTISYKEPEIVEGQSDYTEAVDIWSLGCVFFEFFSLQALFQGIVNDKLRKNELKVKQLILICKANQIDLMDKINSINEGERIIPVLKQMLKPNLQKRIQIDQVVKMLSDLNSQQIPSVQKPNEIPSFIQNPPQLNCQPQKFQSINANIGQNVNNYNQQTQLQLLIQNFQEQSSQILDIFIQLKILLAEINNNMRQTKKKSIRILQLDQKELKLTIRKLNRINQDLLLKQAENDNIKELNGKQRFQIIKFNFLSKKKGILIVYKRIRKEKIQ